MAGHVIDSLFVELGLDSSKFDRQQQEALNRFKQTQEAARKGARDVEDSGRSVVDTLDGIKTQALEMFAVVSGGKSLVAFSTNLTHADAAVGRLSRSTNASVDTISKWQAAARIFGGTAEGMANTFTTISDTVAGFKMGAVSPLLEQFRLLSAAGGTFVDVSKNADEILLAISANMEKISKQDPARAGFLGRSMGFDPASIDMLIRGPGNLQKVLDYVHGIGVATKEDADAFGELEKRIGQMGLKAESMGRKILGGKDGGAEAIIRLADWLHESPADAWSDFKKMYAEQIERSGGVGGFLRDFITFNWNAHSKSGGGKAERLFPTDVQSGPASYREAIASVESRGNGGYSALGPMTAQGDRAYGRYQVMGNNIGEWSQAALGRRLTPQEFLNDPKAQDAVFDYKFGEYVKKYGNPQDAASAWFTGRPQSAGANARDALGTSGAEYVQRFNAGLGSSSTTSNININAPINITTPAGADGAQIARDFRSELLRRQSDAFLANGGQQ